MPIWFAVGFVLVLWYGSGVADHFGFWCWWVSWYFDSVWVWYNIDSFVWWIDACWWLKVCFRGFVGLDCATGVCRMDLAVG